MIWRRLLRALVQEQGVLSTMVEAGGNFSAALFAAGLIDEVNVYYAPILCGGTLPGLAGESFPESLKLEEIDFQPFGDDARLRGIIKR